MANKKGNTAISRLKVGDESVSNKKIVLPKEKPVDTADYICNMLQTSLLIQTDDDPPVRGKKGRIRQAGNTRPDIILKPLEKISSEVDSGRFTGIMKEIGPGGRGRKHAQVLRSRGVLSFVD